MPTIKMNTIKNLTLGLLAVSAIAVLPACQDDIDIPQLVEEVPVASLKPNSTILELKEAYWQDKTPYCVQVGTKENGDHYIVKGRVISSDYAGNIFKSLYIKDETAVLPLSINQYNLYLNYRVGQEVVIDVTGLYIGRYSGLEQLGYPQWSDSYKEYQPTFMQPGILEGHIELDGLPEPEKVDTVLISSIADLTSHATDKEYLLKMQGQLVRLNNVKFVPQSDIYELAVYHETVSQAVQDNSGTSLLTVRTSGYSNFWNTPLPEENGDIVGILGYYYSSSKPETSWQITLIDKEGLMNFGNPTLPLGSAERPYSVTEAVKAETSSSDASGWVEGYIVGTIAPEVENITSSSQIEWGADATLPTSVVIGATPDSRDLDECLVMSLPQGSVMRQYVALANHPENLGKKLTVLGRLEKYMGTYGITGNTGTASEFVLEGVEIVVGGSGTEDDPYDVSKIIEFDPQSTTEAVEEGIWVRGYIVGYYANFTAVFSSTGAVNANVLLAESPSVTDKAKCIDIQLPYGDVRTALNLLDNPGMIGAEVKVYGDVMKYNSMPGIKNTSKYEIITPGTGVDPNPPATADNLDEDFDGSTSLPSGWKAVMLEGNKSWYVASFSGNNYASMTGYKGTAPFDSWLVSPAVDLSKVSAKTLSFTSQVNGYGSTTSTIEVYVLTSDDPATATKTQLPAAWPTPPSSGYSSWLGSGTLDLSAFSGVVYIGFRYAATQDTNYATWCIDNVSLPAK